MCVRVGRTERVVSSEVEFKTRMDSLCPYSFLIHIYGWRGEGSEGKGRDSGEEWKGSGV